MGSLLVMPMTSQPEKFSVFPEPFYTVRAAKHRNDAFAPRAPEQILILQLLRW